jgi:hypothetical protein
MPSIDELIVEQRTRQKSDPHDTNAVDGSVALALIRTDVVPILTVLQLKHGVSVIISISIQNIGTGTYFVQSQVEAN